MIISNITKERVKCRVTEEKILNAWMEGRKARISERDLVICEEYEKIYKLWNTNLVYEDLETKEVRINISSNDDMSGCYFKYGRMDAVIMTQTTKNRLNAFLKYYGFDSLEVHNSMKEGSIKYHGKELKVSSDSWYKLDFTTKELVKC